jgi:ParB family chromosome partitioning protein
MVAENKLSMGHARVLSKLESDDKIIEMAREIVENKLPVRQIEDIAANPEVEKKVKIVRKSNSSNEFKYVEDLLRDKLDTRVKIKERKIEISFNNVADLNRILEVLDVRER